jgi:uncharacterized OB-fold protein
MTSSSVKKLVPLRPGMFEMPETLEGTPRLYGQRCRDCGEVFASAQRVFCANCSSQALERITLGARGEVHSYTVVHQQLRGALVEAPYVIARVKLAEGVTVQTILADVDPAEVRTGMPVEICLRALGETEQGDTLVNFFFRPERT